ncbi:MAG: hypothetical protein A3C12_01970 [Candidatus Sungbacteria bacterium RIFCSPHIGHO2_02_FULL_49_20]|uniref:Uncharacterized protein n=1 Tax=Candidatus Sungbacteria bacterium RIFCSPHIGHO2_02_FULL_49_20 TaxID=1802272 RepID=A0A1G2KN86_9BACT|nr:MAG: hypothetical protein A3C12_01970 [Candidatus Sungbacteria bacterium RIFCSPHIGHO2_02_FULL_49_20]
MPDFDRLGQITEILDGGSRFKVFIGGDGNTRLVEMESFQLTPRYKYEVGTQLVVHCTPQGDPLCADPVG